VTAAVLLLSVALFLLLLNAFFVLAEFSIVSVRRSRIESLVEQGSPGAKRVQHIQDHIDEYLSICQIGITFASIGLGFVGEPAIARLIEPLFQWVGEGRTAFSHGVAITIAYILVSFLHILLGELVPKSIAIRKADLSALRSARLLSWFRLLFFPALFVLNGLANLIVRLLGFSRSVRESVHSEQELRIILEHSQERGLMSFRRLLLLENIFDLGALKVRDAMKPRSSVKVLRASAPWEENLAAIRQARYSRFPLVDGDERAPVGIVHVKDILFMTAGGEPSDLRKLARPYRTAREDDPLEMLLAELQRKRGHLAVVLNAEGAWTGVISFEDVIEEIVGTIEDEFEIETPLFLSDSIGEGRIVLGVTARSLEAAVRDALARVSAADLPAPLETILKGVIEREKSMSTYIGQGLAIPHARLEGIDKPALFFVRSESGVAIGGGRPDRAHLIFILLTPSSAPHVQARMLARIAGLMDSEYVVERLREAATSAEILEAIRIGETASLG
jgi:CBS domain containing-hemolysin-like protein